jgi:uncharacterized protein YlzI (FlbEa/FlbD family)
MATLVWVTTMEGREQIVNLDHVVSIRAWNTDDPEAGSVLSFAGGSVPNDLYIKESAHAVLSKLS